MSPLEGRPAQADLTAGPAGSSPTLLTYFGVLARRRWVALPALVVVPVVAVVLALRETPLYQASAEVLLSHQSLAASLSGVADPSAALQPERVAQTQAELARVPEVARRTLAAAGIHDRTALDFLEASDVSPKSNADLLEFAVRDRNSALAKRLATAYARQFITYRGGLDSAAFDRARRGIQQRLDQLRAAGATRSPLYADLIAKYQQLIAIESLQATSALLVRQADSAPQIRPRPMRAGVLGLGLGLMLGIGLAFLMEALDTRVRTAEEIEERLGLPLLARLPYPPQQLDEQGAMAMLDEAAGSYAESIRTLRVRLGLASPETETQVVMVTSATEREGKSTTVANLAVALAQDGRRVVLCDLDARRPVIDRLFGLTARAGLVEVALGLVELDEALNAVAIPAKPYWSRVSPVTPVPSLSERRRGHARGVLEVLTLGRTPPDPGEFVGSDRVGEILTRLRARADVVLVDAPSLLSVGDAMTVGSDVDGLLVVVRLHALRRSTLIELRRLLESWPVSKLGCVVTAASLDDRYGYQRNYRRLVPAGDKRDSVGS